MPTLLQSFSASAFCTFFMRHLSYSGGYWLLYGLLHIDAIMCYRTGNTFTQYHILLHCDTHLFISLDWVNYIVIPYPCQ